MKKTIVALGVSVGLALASYFSGTTTDINAALQIAFNTEQAKQACSQLLGE